MSQRAHFWLRIAGLAAIFAAQFGPRLWASVPPLARSAQAAELAQPAIEPTEEAEVALMPPSPPVCR